MLCCYFATLISSSQVFPIWIKTGFYFDREEFLVDWKQATEKEGLTKAREVIQNSENGYFKK